MSHTAQHEENHGTGEIKKVTIILSVLTIIELILGFWMIGITSEALRLAIKGTIIILMMAKAFYIVAYFMHLKHELKNLIMTIVVPLGLFVWFIIAFLYDGNSFRNLRNTYDPYFKERSEIKVEQKAHGEHGAAGHGAGASHEAAADTTAHAKDTVGVQNNH
jgi:cytochrome c oxidase subunit IV